MPTTIIINIINSYDTKPTVIIINIIKNYDTNEKKTNINAKTIRNQEFSAFPVQNINIVQQSTQQISNNFCLKTLRNGTSNNIFVVRVKNRDILVILFFI